MDMIFFNIEQIKIFKKIKNRNGTAQCYFNIAKMMYEQKNYSSSLMYFMKALRIQLKLCQLESSQPLGLHSFDFISISQSDSKIIKKSSQRKSWFLKILAHVPKFLQQSPKHE